MLSKISVIYLYYVSSCLWSQNESVKNYINFNELFDLSGVEDSGHIAVLFQILPSIFSCPGTDTSSRG